MSYADWSDEDKQEFDDSAWNDIFAPLDFEGMSQQEIETAGHLFEQGWLNWEISPELAEEYKEAFYDLTAYGPEDFDWESFRELYDSING